jgi:FecR protein
MTTVKRLALLISAVLFITALSAMSFGEDPPSRAARLNYISGSVSVQPGGANDWVEAGVNRTLTTSDRIWADKDSRAELQFDGAAMRIDSETSATLTNVSDNTTQIELDQGALYLSVLRLFPGQIYEVDTPNTAFTVLKPGRYRFDVDSNGDTTRIVVHRGEGQASGDGPAVTIHEREGARFSGGRSMAHNMFEDPGYDGFDQWAAVRDKRMESSVSARYVSPGVVGYQDLDDYGYWRNVPPYGPMWVPTAVVPGWAPYHYGHWVWVSPWGWTWVDDAPWGYAPFHYGRWAFVDGYWGWVPGPVYARPVWAPALVAWVGGPSWGVSIGFGVGGGYGWFPLGWREPFVPWYGGSRHYFQQVNVTNTNITNITNVTNNYYNNTTNINRIKYVNQRVPGAVTAVPAGALASGRPVQSVAVKVNPNQLRGATVMAKPNVAPTQNAVLGPHAGARASMPPRAAMERPVVTKMAPPSPRQTFPGQRGVVTQGNRPGQPTMNAAKPGATSPVVNNAPKPGMNVAKPGMPSNTGMGNKPAMANENKPEFSPNVHRPPSAAGGPNNAPGVVKTNGPGNAPAINAPHPGATNGAVNRTVQVNPNVPRPGESGGHANAAATTSTAPVQHGNVQQESMGNVQPKQNVGGNVSRPVNQGSSYPHPGTGANTRVNESSGQNSPRGGSSGGTRVSQPSNKGGPDKATPKNEEHSRPQGSVYSPGVNSNAGNYPSRVPRPQPGQVRSTPSATSASRSYGSSGQQSYNRGSYGSQRSSSNGNQGYGGSPRASNSQTYGNRGYGSAGSSNRAGASTAGSYSRGGGSSTSAGSYSRGGGSYSRSSGSSGGSSRSSGGGHSHGR